MSFSHKFTAFFSLQRLCFESDWEPLTHVNLHLTNVSRFKKIKAQNHILASKDPLKKLSL